MTTADQKTRLEAQNAALSEALAYAEEVLRDVAKTSGLSHSDAESCADQAREALTGCVSWWEIDTAPAGRVVLVHYRNARGEDRVVRAEYVKRFTLVAPDESDAKAEYHPEDGELYAVEGWYEVVDNADECSHLPITEGVPDGWRHLPVVPDTWREEDADHA